MNKSVLLWLTLAGHSVGASELEEVLVEGRNADLVGSAVSASEGVIGQKEIALRPLLRTGEVLELVPGMVVTQHSGTGKANQYFLRGFNLDHGTDFANFVDGMPVNMRSHGHGQGYTDLNFLIPETVSKISYKKGAYYAEIGDFSGAGSAQIETVSTANNGRLSATLGEDDYYRLLLMGGVEMAGGHTVYAVEGNGYEGPWSDIEEDLEKTNVLLKHTMPLENGHFHFGLMAYDNSWNSADQIPERAVTSGVIDQLGSLDETVGGESSRYSVNVDWLRNGLHASAYFIDYQLNLWSNFTYFLDDAIDGDQFEQVDDRKIFGGQANYTFNHDIAGNKMRNRVGVDWRRDDIDEVGLYHTQARKRLGVTRKDTIEETSLGAYWENRYQWNSKLRTVLGARYDYFDFEVNDRAGINRNGIDLSANGGSADDDIFSLKGSAIYSFSDQLEAYVSAGQGFHSNDARGTVIHLDPADGGTVDAVDPLVRSFGYEAGIRAFVSNKLNASLALWTLELDSELVFVGDAGNTEPSRESTRQGLEVTAYYQLDHQWSLDIEYAYSDAEFEEDAAAGDEIPGAIEHVLQAGITAELDGGWFASLRLRYFGERPLTEDGSVQSDDSTIWNLRAGYQYKTWIFKADLLNLTDSDDHDIDYFYESRLASEPSGVAAEDIHFHVIEPRTLRLTVEKRL